MMVLMFLVMQSVGGFYKYLFRAIVGSVVCRCVGCWELGEVGRCWVLGRLCCWLLLDGRNSRISVGMVRRVFFWKRAKKSQSSHQ